ncbi:MAG: Tol-Pal system protein TolB [Sulfurovum sp.]
MRYLLVVLLFMNFFVSNLMGIDARLKIEKDVEHRGRIAIMDGSSNPSNKVFKIFLADLKISGHFLPNTNHYTGNFANNTILSTLKRQDYVLKYKLNRGRKLSIKLFKASTNRVILKKDYNVPQSNKMPFLVHKAISDINKVLGYPSISWLNRYVVYTVYTGAKRSEIRLADYTFTYTKTIVRGGLNLFPKWANSKQSSIYYTSYRELRPTLYKLNIYNGSKRRIASSDGMIVCSDVSRNGSKILVTMAPNGQPDIYEMSASGGSKRRITNFNGIDVNGRYINGERGIVFVSNRMGKANIFKKSISGRGASKIGRGSNNNACDAYGNRVIYSSRESNSAFGGNKFNIYLTSSSGSGSRRLTSTGANQFPRFSSNGSVVLFLKQRKNRTSIGYTNLNSRQSLLFPFNGRKIQSIDW